MTLQVAGLTFYTNMLHVTPGLDGLRPGSIPVGLHYITITLHMFLIIQEATSRWAVTVKTCLT